MSIYIGQPGDTRSVARVGVVGINVTSGGIVPTGTLYIGENGVADVTNFANALVNVEPLLQAKTNITPTESSQTITYDNGYDGLSSVQINAISDTYVGSGITKNPTITTSGSLVSVPKGYYSSNQSISISTANIATPIVTINNSTGVITATQTQSAGYVSSGTTTGTLSLTTKGAATITPTTTDQTIAASTFLTGAQTIKGDANLIASNIVSGTTIFGVTGTATGGGGSGSGSNYTRTEICPSTTFSVSSAGGYTLLNNSERLEDGEEYIITFDNVEYTCHCEELYGTDRFVGDLVLSWGNTSSDYIFPFCIEDWNSNQVPLIYARDTSSHTVKIEKIEFLNNGLSLTTKTITANGTYDAEDDSADGYSSVTVSIPTGTATAPSTISGSSASITTGTNLITLSKTISVTPTISTAGYISSGTAGNSAVSLSASVTTKGAATITPGTTDQTIAAGTYLTGAQTISGDANLIAANIISGKTIFGVAGSAAGGGSNWTKIGSQEFTVNTTSTSASSVGNISLTLSDYNDKNIIVWVHVRDKAGKRSGYFYGSDAIFLNYILANNSTDSITTRPFMLFRYTSSSTYATSTSSYGVYGYRLYQTSSNHYVEIYKRYNNSNSGTINGTYVCDVYTLTLPSGFTLFT